MAKTPSSKLVVAPIASPSVEIINATSFLERLELAMPTASLVTNVLTPTAYGVGWGNLFFGITGQNGTQTSTAPFGRYALGFGLGDPDKFVSLTTTMTLGGLDNLTRDGNVNLQLSRNLLFATAIAIGVENLAPWGANVGLNQSEYLVLSHLFTIGWGQAYAMSMITTLGVGNNRFVNDVNPTEADVHQYRPFAGIDLQLFPQLSVMTDYVGQTFNAGVSVIPFVKWPLALSLTAIDLTHKGGDRIPIAASAGIAIHY